MIRGLLSANAGSASCSNVASLISTITRRIVPVNATRDSNIPETAEHVSQPTWKVSFALLPRHGDAIFQLLVFFLGRFLFAKLNQKRAKRATGEDIARVVSSDRM